MPRELPPTAGLPLQLRDLLPRGSRARREDVARKLAQVLDLPPLIPTSSGAAALWTVLETLKARNAARRVVVVPAFTCPLVPLAVHQAGLQVRLCDTRPGHFDLDLAQLRGLCRDDTLAVITTHLGGRVADAAGAMAIAHAAGAALVEDAAQALGARSGAHSVGLTGDAGVFSLGAGKGLSIYAGGLIVARDPGLREALVTMHAALAQPRRGHEAWRCVQLLGLALLYNPAGLRLAYGLPLRRALRRQDVIGALSERFAPRIVAHQVSRWRLQVACRAAARLGTFLHDGAARAQERCRALAALPGVTVLQDAPGDAGTWPYFLLRLPDAARRDRALAALWHAGLGASRAFGFALPDYPELQGIVPAAQVPQARDFAARTLTVSNTHWMTQPAFGQVLASLAAALR